MQQDNYYSGFGAKKDGDNDNLNIQDDMQQYGKQGRFVVDRLSDATSDLMNIDCTRFKIGKTTIISGGIVSPVTNGIDDDLPGKESLERTIPLDMTSRMSILRENSAWIPVDMQKALSAKLPLDVIIDILTWMDEIDSHPISTSGEQINDIANNQPH